MTRITVREWNAAIEKIHVASSYGLLRFGGHVIDKVSIADSMIRFGPCEITYRILIDKYTFDTIESFLNEVTMDVQVPVVEWLAQPKRLCYD